MPPDAPSVATLIGWLIRTVVTLTSVASSAIDHESEQRFVAFLEPFAALGPSHPGAVAYDYGRLLVKMTEDRYSEVHRGWSELLERLPELDLAPAILARMRLGATVSLGLLESHLDDDAALARLDRIEGMGFAQAQAMMNQVRFLYHGFRGEIELAQRYRDRVETYAMQHGSAWQVETWSTCTLNAVYGVTRDKAGNRRVVEQLERLKKSAPSLEIYWERAVATQHRLTGDPARAAAMYERTLARPGARDRVGWATVRGNLAGAYNQMGKHETAKRICEETLPEAIEDREYVAAKLGLWIELGLAHAGLGHFDLARRDLAALLARHLPRHNPVTLGTVYRALASVALLEKDKALFERYLAEMERWYGGTKNPALVAQCEELRNAAGRSRADGFAESRTIGPFPSTGMLSVVQSVLAPCRGADERRLRALELVSESAGAKEAWLFTIGRSNEPAMVCALGVSKVPSALLSEVALLIQRWSGSEETACIDPGDAGDAGPTTDPTRPYRLFPLTVTRGSEDLLVGAIVTPMSPALRMVEHGLLQELSSQLFDAGDVGTR